MENLLVSIVIPVYNGSNYLAEAIDSALAQTYKNIEILVVNDGSKDDGATQKVALSYGNKIRYFSKENGGVSSALNLGIKEMKGDYFSWLSHDDMYSPDKIQKQINKIQEIKNTDKNDVIVLCSGYLVDQNKKRIPHNDKTISGEFNGLELFDEFLNGYSLNGLGFLIPKEVFNESGLFDENMRYLQDLDLWLRIMQNDKYCFVCLNELLVITRIHKNQVTNTSNELFDVDRKKLAQKHMELIKTRIGVYYDEMLKMYYLLFLQGNNKTGENLVKAEMHKRNIFTSKLKFKSIIYLIRRIIKLLFRKLYSLLFRVKKMRGKE